MPLSVMALLGIVGLTGVVVNDSLVMVEYINQLRKEHPDWSVLQCVQKGAVDRLRPILLTTITTVGGLLPTAYGLGGKDALIIPTALALAWGLVFATLLTLVLIPALYLVENDVQKLAGRIFPQKNKRKT
jgi:multidrug efflux pump subunit AcrB